MTEEEKDFEEIIAEQLRDAGIKFDTQKGSLVWRQILSSTRRMGGSLSWR
jgi:hypothetical protein